VAAIQSVAAEQRILPQPAKINQVGVTSVGGRPNSH